MAKNGDARRHPSQSFQTSAHSSAAGNQTLAGSLPAGLTSLVGRADELHALHNLLPDQRLITLVGPGGVGKTRLAVALAAQNQERYSQGVCFVPLVAVTTSELLISSIATALNFTFYSREEPMVQLTNFLHTKEMLLVLDNFKQLREASNVLTNILERASRVSLIVTSRERLNCYGEQVFMVGPLPFPDSEGASITSSHSAVHLFVKRAQSVRPDFTLTADNRLEVVRICRLLGGLPLALELAATRAKLLSCAEIAQELEENLDFLTATLSGIPERHRTLRAVFIHSWQHLKATERQAFQALCIFPAGFTRAAAEAVAAATLSDLSSLLDNWLLQ